MNKNPELVKFYVRGYYRVDDDHVLCFPLRGFRSYRMAATYCQSYFDDFNSFFSRMPGVVKFDRMTVETCDGSPVSELSSSAFIF